MSMSTMSSGFPDHLRQQKPRSSALHSPFLEHMSISRLEEAPMPSAGCAHEAQNLLYLPSRIIQKINIAFNYDAVFSSIQKRFMLYFITIELHVLVCSLNRTMSAHLHNTNNTNEK